MLLSLFGYPGSGHFLLKRPRRGLVWAAFFSVLLAGLIGSFAYNLYKLYGGAVGLGDIRVDWAPTLALVALAAAFWMGAAIDAGVLSKRQIN